MKVRVVNGIRDFGSFSCKWCEFSVGGFEFIGIEVNVISLLFGDYGCKVKI